MARKASPEESQAARELEEALAKEGVDLTQQSTDAPTAAPAPLAMNTQGDEPPVKRGPGRPPKNAGAAKDADALLFNAIGDKDKPADGKAKPGRPKGTGTKKSMDPVGLAKQLVGIHQLAAMFTGMGELQLNPDEASGLADAVVNVCAEYDLNIDGKTGAAVQLFAACAMIYAPRVMAIKYRLAQEAAANEQANATTANFAQHPAG